jgi:transposase
VQEPVGRLHVSPPQPGAPKPHWSELQMKHYPQELKDRLTARMLAPHNESVTALAGETRIPKDTLYGWRTAALGRVKANPVSEPAHAALSSDDKFAVVVETARLNAHELGEYCRTHGLFTQQVHNWRERCTSANATAPSRAEQEQAREQAREIRQLRTELQRKEKALAEAAALLLLQKKVQSLWGEDGAARSTSRSASK